MNGFECNENSNVNETDYDSTLTAAYDVLENSNDEEKKIFVFIILYLKIIMIIQGDIEIIVVNIGNEVSQSKLF